MTAEKERAFQCGTIRLIILCLGIFFLLTGSVVATDQITESNGTFGGQTDGTATANSTEVNATGSTAYVATDSLYAYNTDTGERGWEFDRIAEGSTSPVVHQGTVYVGDTNGKLYAVDAVTGNLEWKANLSAGRPVQVDPVIVNNTIYAAAGDNVSALTTAGTERWTVSVGDDLDHSPVVSEGTLYVNVQGSLVAVDAKTGEEQWLFGNSTEVTSGPAVVGDSVYIVSRVGRLGETDDSISVLHAVDANTGTEQWRADVDDTVDAPPVVSNGSIYLLGDFYVQAFERASGSELWKVPHPDGPRWRGSASMQPTVKDGMLYYGSTSYARSDGVQGILSAVDVQTGERRWQRKMNSRVGPPTVVGGHVYVLTERGTLYQIATDNSTETVLNRTRRTSSVTTPSIAANPSGGNSIDSAFLQRSRAENPESEFEVSVEAKPDRLPENDSLTVVARVENTGNVQDVQTISLTNFEGERSDTSRLALDPGGQKQVELSWEAPATTGTDEIAIQSRDSRVAETVTITDHSVFTPKVENRTRGVVEGETVRVNATVTNDGSVRNSQTVSLSVEGEIRDQTRLELAPGETKPVTLRWETVAGDVGHPMVSIATNDASDSTELTIQSDGIARDRTVYVGRNKRLRGEQKVIAAIDARSGVTEWTLDVGHSSGEPLSRQEQVESAPTVVSGVVYIGTSTGVLAANATSGERLWEFDAPGGVTSSPTVVNGTVYVTARNGGLYAINSTGGEQWSAPVERASRSPLVSHGRVFITEGSGPEEPPIGAAKSPQEHRVESTGSVIAFDADTGEKEWEFTTEHGIESSPTIAGDIVFVGESTTTGGENATVYGLSVSNGTEGFEYETSDQQVLTPVVDNQRVYVASSNQLRRTVPAPAAHESMAASSNTTTRSEEPPDRVEGGTLAAINRSTGETEWRVETKTMTNPPGISGKNVYITESSDIHDTTVRALDRESGEEKWSSLGPISTPTILGETLYGNGGILGRMSALDSTTGEIEWETGIRVPKRGKISAPTVVSDPREGHSVDSRVAHRTLGHHKEPIGTLDPTIVTTNDPIYQGDTLVVEATVANPNASTATGTVDILDFSGQVIKSEEIRLGGGEETTITAAWKTGVGDGGTGEITVQTPTIERAEDATIIGRSDTEVEIVETNAPVVEQEQLSTTVEVRNFGEKEVTDVIEFSVGEIFTTHEEITVNGTTSRELTFEWRPGPDAIGEQEVTVSGKDNSDRTTITVNEFNIEAEATGRYLCAKGVDSNLCYHVDVTASAENGLDPSVADWNFELVDETSEQIETTLTSVSSQEDNKARLRVYFEEDTYNASGEVLVTAELGNKTRSAIGRFQIGQNPSNDLAAEIVGPSAVEHGTVESFDFRPVKGGDASVTAEWLAPVDGENIDSDRSDLMSGTLLPDGSYFFELGDRHETGTMTVRAQVTRESDGETTVVEKQVDVLSIPEKAIEIQGPEQLEDGEKGEYEYDVRGTENSSIDVRWLDPHSDENIGYSQQHTGEYTGTSDMVGRFTLQDDQAPGTAVLEIEATTTDGQELHDQKEVTVTPDGFPLFGIEHPPVVKSGTPVEFNVTVDSENASSEEFEFSSRAPELEENLSPTSHQIPITDSERADAAYRFITADENRTGTATVPIEITRHSDGASVVTETTVDVVPEGGAYGFNLSVEDNLPTIYGGTYRANVTLSNPNPITASQNITLAVNGDKVDKQSVELDQNETTAIELIWDIPIEDTQQYVITIASGGNKEEYEIEQRGEF